MATVRDRDAEHIVTRKWDDIRRAWLDYIPTHDSPWPVPEHEINELPSLQDELETFPADHRRNVDSETREEEITGLRAAALHEAVILIHKAANVLRATAEEGSSGYRTWSRSSAYHSAFFAMRGVLGILGVFVVPSNDRKRDFQIDIWAPRRAKGSRSPGDSEFAVRIMPRRPVKHKELWSIFRRVLRVSQVGPEIWPRAGNYILKKLDITAFSAVRHRVHYRTTGWIYDDLDNLCRKDDLENLAEEVLNLHYLGNPDHGSFPLSLALHILSLGVALMSDIGKEVPKVQAEADRTSQWMRNAPWKCANVFKHVGSGNAE